MIENDKPDNLLRSILLAESKILPAILPGSGGCVNIASPQGSAHDITICEEDQNNQQNVLAVLKIFTDCRGGIEIGSATNTVDPLKVAQMVNLCGGTGKFKNPLSLIKQLTKKKADTSLLGKKNADWFHPGSDYIPGVPEPKQPEV